MMKRSFLFVMLGLAFAARPGFANEYEVFVDIADEEDLHVLVEDGQIDEQTFDALITLLNDGIDLNTASRNELYSLPNLSYADVDQILRFRAKHGSSVHSRKLSQMGVLSPAKANALSAFLISEKKPKAMKTRGWAKTLMRWSTRDGFPATSVRVHGSYDGLVTSGVGIVSQRRRVRRVLFDPVRGALSADVPKTTLRFPKAYWQYKSIDHHAIVGTFLAGFGQRLTFDNTNRYQPHGFFIDNTITRGGNLVTKCKESAGELEDSPCAGAAGRTYVSPDFQWRSGLTGIGLARTKQIVGGGHLQIYGFVSRRNHAIYQYELYNRLTCDDPRNDDDDGCAAPFVFRRNSDSLAPTSRFTFQTLPGMYQETTTGGHVSYRASPRAKIGATAYHASINWHVDEMELDFQEWSRRPFGGPFGAIGVDAAWGRRWFDGFVEVAHSFDSMGSGGGGPAVLLRNTATFGVHELETVLRYYDTDYANPYSRATAASDEFEGLRARDETGARIRYTGAVNADLGIQATADVWYQLSAKRPKTALFVRTDYAVSRRWDTGIWLRYQNRNLRSNGHAQCFDAQRDEELPEGEPDGCGGGQEIRISAQIRMRSPKWSVQGQIRGALVDDVVYDDRFRRDLAAQMSASYRVSNTWSGRIRSRYLYEDIDDNQRLEQSLRSLLEVNVKLLPSLTLTGRYDLIVHLDDRSSTIDRIPSPESWFWLGLVSNY